MPKRKSIENIYSIRMMKKTPGKDFVGGWGWDGDGPGPRGRAQGQARGRDSPGIYRSPLNQVEGAAVAGSWKGWGERAPPYRGHQYYIAHLL